jgi:uncharacterized protein (DUF58 family)
VAPAALSIPTESFGRFERLSFVTRRPARAGLGGEHRSRNRSPSTDFVDYRPYQPGDDFRRVDWNVYARLGSLQVKLTEGRERLDVVLVLDCSSSMGCGQPDKLQFGAQLVAALGHVGMARSDTVRIECLRPVPGVSTASDEAVGFGPFRRRSRFPELVRQLSKIAPAGMLDVNACLAACLPDSTRQPLVIVVSDLLTPYGVSAGLESLVVKQADTVVLHIVSPQELDPQLSGEVELIDAETDEALEVGVSVETLAAYRVRFAKWLDDRESECHQRGIRYVRLRTDRPIQSIVLDDLRRAGVLR